VLPDGVTCVAARILNGDHRDYFVAGRECAVRAIREVTGVESDHVLARGPAGDPVWPAGLTGSITHTGDYVAAAVALASRVRGVGLDAEQVASADRASRVASVVMRPAERSLGGADLSDPLRVLLLFSVKEAVFKCLYPLVLERFDYPALEVTDLDLGRGRFRARLTAALPGGFGDGYPLSGGIEFDATRVYAGICLPLSASLSPRD
jgi:enterobactin synthetase component D